MGCGIQTTDRASIQPRSGDILPIVRCGSFKTIVDLDDFDALRFLLFFQSLQGLPSASMLVTGNDTNWQHRIWQFAPGVQQCPGPGPKLREDPKKVLNKVAHTNDIASSDAIAFNI